jgi:hypothetical protein
MTKLVYLEGELVATVGASRYFLAPRIEALADDDPVARKVVLMCVYALGIEIGQTDGPYSDQRAAAFADAALAELEPPQR